MAPTFYGVLGVGPDADAEAIETGYRERVREVHPDVNDDPDAEVQFRRLTTAKETLLDADERARYDRLGHASYVRHHVSCSAWESTVSGTGGVDSRDSGEVDGRDPGAEARDPTDSGNSESSAARNGRPSGANRATGQSRRTGRQRHHSRQGSSRRPGGGAGGATGERTVGATGATGRDARTARGSGEGPGRDSGDGRGPSSRGGRGRSRADAAGDASYATSSFWDSQRVGKRYGTTSDRRRSLLVRLFSGARALGPWVLVHLVFLASAVGMSWYVYVVMLDAHAVSPLLLVVLVGEIVLAATLSTIHIITRIYR